jgi:hypothetical protein
MADFIVERLSVDKIPLAFPLIREVAPTLDLRQWTRFARRAADPRRAAAGGIFTVRRGARAFPCGLVCFSRDRGLADTSVLTAEYFVAMDLLHSSEVLKALADALEAEARRLGCSVLRSLLPETAVHAAPDLLATGHRLEGSVYVKDLGLAGRPSRTHVCATRRSSPGPSRRVGRPQFQPLVPVR